MSQFSPRTDVDAYWIRIDDDAGREGLLYAPTMHAQGTWRLDEQHFAATGALMVHCLEQHEPREDMQIGRIAFDILGVIPLEPSEVVVKTIRPGRTIELLQADLSVDGRLIAVARAWRLAIQDSEAVAGSDLPPMKPLDECEKNSFEGLWRGGTCNSVVSYVAPGAKPGRSQVWLTTPYAVVANEPVGPVAEFMSVIDTANGSAVRVSPQEWMFPNVDLTVHFFRTPTPGATGLDLTVSMGPTGLGTTMTTLHDVNGPVGCMAQELTVREMLKS